MKLKESVVKGLVKLGNLLKVPEAGISPMRYEVLLRNIRILMLIITIIPLLLMATINYHQYQSRLKQEIVDPMKVLVNKTKHSFELFLAGRLSTVNFIASAYTYEELADEENLQRIFRVLRAEFEGFVDIGLIDPSGRQVSYAGPYELQGKNYAEQPWFEQVKVRGVYISDVFKGFRQFPHLVIAVQHFAGSGGRWWIVRVTIDTGKFDELIAAMGLRPDEDAFLINHEGILQTGSKFCGAVLDRCAVSVPPQSYEPNVLENTFLTGRDTIVTYAYFTRANLILMVVKPKAEVLKAWYTLKSEIVFVFGLGVIIIVAVVFRLTGTMVNRLKESDQKRELAMRQMQHSHKLSSIGRLAAGVAHEINNPLAVINEKVGLVKDLLEYRSDRPDMKDVLLRHLSVIVQAIDRCSAITHRLLGFARRMDVAIESLDVNEVIEEVLSFVEKDAAYRNVRLERHLAEDLSRITSDRGQLQQVFLNLFNNSLAAVEDGGWISIATANGGSDTIKISVQDNGCGMSEETMRHIFEPFFTTKKGEGTGLGLSITHGIVSRLGGEIQVKSAVGEGTRFTVHLPKIPPEIGEENRS
ncbi:MAG: ATP-binding protein [Desulfomonilaceae bacterium]|nr:ATP-binding protein [Desulfomonilaceae bacterium]